MASSGEGGRLMRKDESAAVVSTLRDLRGAQGYALNAAAIFIEIATAKDPDTRADVGQQFRTFRDLYSKTLSAVLSRSDLIARDAKAKALIETVREVGTRFQALSRSDGFESVTPAQAGELVHFVRLSGVPALMQLTSIVSGCKKSHDKARQALMRDRISQLDQMFTEVEQIGQMIHLISLNASVEAARAGGESGRSFKVIADEIRGLAQQASKLIDTTRAGVLPGAEADVLNMRG